MSGTDLWAQRNFDGAHDAECAEAWEMLKAAGLIDDFGSPTTLLRQTANQEMRADQLKNVNVQDAMLQRDPGSSLTQWWKLSSDRFTTSEGHSFELHFYRNIDDGAEILDMDFHVVFESLF